MTSDTNLWRLTATDGPTSRTLCSDLSVDIAIIGGGFTGCAAALQAARMGASVCLLEAETIGHGGSGRNVGLVNAGLWLPPETVIAQMGQEAGLALIDRLAAAPSQVFGLIESEAISCEAVRNGTLHLAHSAAGLRDLAERHRQGRALGAPLILLDAAETARRTGTKSFHGALFDPRAGTIQPLSYVRGLADAAVRAGARLFVRTPVQSLQRSGGEGPGGAWRLETQGGTVTAQAVLVATNAYHLAPLAGFRPAYAAVSYCQFATRPLPESLRRRILPGGEGCWDTATVMSSFRMDRAGRLILGGIGNSDGPGGPVHAAWARRKLAVLFPDLADYPFDHAWQGRIAMTADHIPKIVSIGPDAYACFGFSGRGIGPGTVFGTSAARALLLQAPAELPIAPVTSHDERFQSLRSAWYETGACLIHAVSQRAPRSQAPHQTAPTGI